MPAIFQHKGYRFFFFSNEGNPREPVHVHVRKGEARAKFWLEPQAVLASSYRMSAQELKELESVVKERSARIKEKWNEHFGD